MGADEDVTVVHLMRHGEVFNPEGVLYGRLPGYHLSELGVRMAGVVADHLADRDIAYVAASPLERARETAAPVAARHGVGVATDRRLIEAKNSFEGKTFGVGAGAMRNPRYWKYLRNPFRPSWGEPYIDQVVRMASALDAARERARGREAVLVSHQVVVWVLRSYLEGRRLLHDPRKRQCSLASLTSFTYEGDRLVSVGYSEPAKHLVRSRDEASSGPGFGA